MFQEHSSESKLNNGAIQLQSMRHKMLKNSFQTFKSKKSVYKRDLLVSFR